MRLPETWVSQFQRMAIESIATGKYPWKTSQEVARGILALGFKAVGDEYPSDETDAFLAQVNVERVLAENMRNRRSCEAILALAKENIKGLLAIDATLAAHHAFETCVVEAKHMAENVWRDWLLNELARAYPAFAKAHDEGRAPGVPLTHRRTRRSITPAEKNS